MKYEHLSTEKIAYKVFGLDCPEEIAILKKEVGGEIGVLDLDFDILNAKMIVTSMSGEITPDKVIAAVSAGGMQAILWKDWLKKLEEMLGKNKRIPEADKKRQIKEIHTQINNR